MHTAYYYRHYTLVRDGQTRYGVTVLNPHTSKPLYVAQNLKDAKDWVTAYRDGRTWAVLSALFSDVPNTAA